MGFGILVLSAALAQSSPSDLTDASLADLLQMDVDQWRGEEKKPKFSFDYTYLRSAFKGHRRGTKQVSDDEVLFDPASGEPRTATNFPVMQTEIDQTAHFFKPGWQIDDRIGVSVSVPIIRQSSDHVSIVPGYDSFAIASSGIGDVQLAGQFIALSHEKAQLSTSIGLSIPVGSIDKQGDTPRAPGDQQLPYTMQIGSGTWDVPLSASYSGTSVSLPLNWQVEVAGRVRLGRNARGYRLGHRARGSGTLGFRVAEWLEPRLTASAIYWERIQGQDDDLMVPGDFPFPTAVTDPALFGGEKLSLGGGLVVGIPGSTGRLSYQRLVLQLSLPVLQSLNGPQPQESYTVSTGLHLAY